MHGATIKILSSFCSFSQYSKICIHLFQNFSCFGEPWMGNSGLDSGGLNGSFVKFVDLIYEILLQYT